MTVIMELASPGWRWGLGHLRTQYVLNIADWKCQRYVFKEREEDDIFILKGTSILTQEQHRGLAGRSKVPYQSVTLDVTSEDRRIGISLRETYPLRV